MKSLIMIGASGVGKGTIIANMIRKYPRIFQMTLSFTTRDRRMYERDGVHYFFVSQEEFQRRKPEMLEHKQVFKNHYGTSRTHVEDILGRGKIPILDVDFEGMLEIRNKIPCEVLCVMPASWELLKKRLSGRKTDAPEIVKLRIEESQQQVKKMNSIIGYPNVNYVTNFEYQLTTYGIEKWLKGKFEVF